MKVLISADIDGVAGVVNPAQGQDASFDAVFLTGYHTGAGRHGVLSHTVNGFAFAAIRSFLRLASDLTRDEVTGRPRSA